MALMEIIDKADKIANYTACATTLLVGIAGIYCLFKPELTNFKNKIKDYIINRANNKGYQKKL